MKKKRKKGLQSFLITLFLGALFLFWAMDTASDFLKGFTQAVVGDGSNPASENAGTDVALVLARVLSIAFVCIIFLMIKKKVSDPVKRLSQSMECVREGDLDADMEVLDSFEFGQMEKDFKPESEPVVSNASIFTSHAQPED